MKNARTLAEMNEDLMSHGFFIFFVVVGRLMREEDGTFAIDCDDSGVLFVEASSPISVGELRDDRLLHSYENFCPLDRSNIPEIGGLLDVLPLFAAQV
jgi:hypothetical protein